LKNKLAKLKDCGEISIHLVFKLNNLMLCHLVFGVIEDFFTQHFKNVKIILTNVHIFHRTLTNVVDESDPTGLPFILDYLHKNGIAFGKDVMHRF
jgi:hypothetical protein